MTTATATLEPVTKRTPTRSAPLPTARSAQSGYDRIVLTGFMGSGKSTTGTLLAARLGWTFLDLDTEIERRCGLTVPQIFAELGETHFRRQETAALASVLGRSHVVIALGGGAPEELGNRLLLEQTPGTAVVFLSAPFNILYDRCQVQATSPGATERPVLADRQKAEARFAARLRHYERIAHSTLDTTTLSVEETLEALLLQLPQLHAGKIRT
jgi:shikimate kinase